MLDNRLTAYAIIIHGGALACGLGTLAAATAASSNQGPGGGVVAVLGVLMAIVGILLFMRNDETNSPPQSTNAAK